LFPVSEPVYADLAILAISGRKVAVLGAAGGIGQPLSLLLKDCDLVAHLALYDVAPAITGVAVDLSHCSTPVRVTGHRGPEELGAALRGADVVVIPAGIPRKPGMSRDDLFATNASIVQALVRQCARHCPRAVLAIISNPINSMVPIAAEVLRQEGVYDPRKVIGVTALDVARANTWVAEALAVSPRALDVPVIGGHAGTTILPLLSRVPGAEGLSAEAVQRLTHRIQFGGDEVVAAKGGLGSATLSMAYAGTNFVRRLLSAMNGERGVVECCYTANEATPVTYFALPTLLGPNGAEGVYALPPLSMAEVVAYSALLPELQRQVDRGTEFGATG